MVRLGFENIGGMKVCVKKEKDWNKEKWYNGRARLFESELELDMIFPFPI